MRSTAFRARCAFLISRVLYYQCEACRVNESQSSLGTLFREETPHASGLPHFRRRCARLDQSENVGGFSRALSCPATPSCHCSRRIGLRQLHDRLVDRRVHRTPCARSRGATSQHAPQRSCRVRRRRKTRALLDRQHDIGRSASAVARYGPHGFRLPNDFSKHALCAHDRRSGFRGRAFPRLQSLYRPAMPNNLNAP